jgi:ABC-type multidrug transport system ATPase subunit
MVERLMPVIVGRLELQFLDEPTTGLDPEAREAERRRGLAGR